MVEKTIPKPDEEANGEKREPLGLPGDPEVVVPFYRRQHTNTPS